MAASPSRTVTLRLLGNSKDLTSTIDKANAMADELEKRGVTVNIVADTAEAQAGIDSVTEAEERFRIAQQEVIDAQAQLDAVRADSTATAEDQAAAEDLVTEATLRSLDAQEQLGAADLRASEAAKVAGDSQESLAAKTDAASDSAKGSSAKWGMVSLGLLAAAGVSVKMAANFQTASEQLVTGAGQSEKGLAAVKQGMLDISSATGTSATEVVSGMYLIESAGFHGADGLKVLQAAAEGAKVGNANLADVANAVTSALNAYHLPASAAVAVTNELVATTASGKMHMDDLARALGNILPVAASAHISLAQVGAAMAEMTMQGMNARRASMNLRNLIVSLQAPGAAASAEMRALGLNANDLSRDMGKVGLTGTIQTLTQAILDNTKGGSVAADTFRGMTPAVKGLAIGILQGKVTTDQLSTAIKGLSPQQAALITQFSKSASSATGMSQTFDAAMKTMTGGSTGLQVALLLGGAHMKDFAANAKAIQFAADHAGISVNGWSKIQGDLDQQLDVAKTSVENLAIEFGSALLPVLTSILKPLADLAAWFVKVPGLGKTLMVLALGFLSVYAAISGFNKLSNVFSTVGQAVMKLATWLGLYTAGEGEATAGQWSLNAAMDANPIGVIVLALAVLVTAILLLWTHCKAFRDFWIDAWNDIRGAFATVFDWIKGHWPLIVGILTGPVGLAIAFIVTHWTDFKNTIVDVTTDLWHDVDHIWDTIWSDTIGYVIRGASNVYTHISNLKTDIGNLFAGAGRFLWNAGEDLINGLYGGAKAVIADVGSWASSIGSDIVNAVKHFFGIHSPSTVFAQIGQYLMLGLLKGMIGGSTGLVDKVFGSMANALVGVIGKGLMSLEGLPSKVLSILGNVLGHMPGILGGLLGDIGSLFGLGGGGGSGVAKYTPIALEVLGLLGQPTQDLGTVMTQMNTESGGNPDAVNRTDTNWQEGHPSVGLMQVIAGTFDAYAGPFRNLGPFAYGVSENPLANIYAGLNYAVHRYGPGWTGVLGHGHGYFAGGLINEPIWGIGASGTSYTFGERGAEWVTPVNAGQGGGDTYYITVQGDTDPDAAARRIHQKLRTYRRHNGNMNLGLG